MALQQEIEARSKHIKTDSYPMSIGELLHLYADEEIDVHPEFQRIYRWKETQKSKLIESILLGIPLPPIFVAQRTDGVWDVVDGVQRLSTIFQFVGVLKDEDKKPVPPLVLQKTKYLPSLEGMSWNNPKDKNKSFTKDQQMYIKRAKIDFNIVLKESDKEAKHELFMRLNTGGSALSAQEVRNCLLIMEDLATYEWLRDIAQEDNFKEAIALSDRSIEEQYHMELALRFIVFRTMADSDLSRVEDIGQFLDNRIPEIVKLKGNSRKCEENAFKATFKRISEELGSDSFHRFDSSKAKFVGGFSISAFEALGLGVGFHYQEKTGLPSIPELPIKVKQLWDNNEFIDNSGSGVRASARIPKIVPLGRRLFCP